MRFPEFSGEWEKTTLAKECAINPPTPKLAEKFVYVDLESVSKGQLVKLQVIAKEEAPSRAQRVLSDNDVLFQCVRPYQKNNYLYHAQQGEIQWVASTGYAQLRTNCNNPAFIYHILNTDSFNKKVMVRCTGSSYPAINSEDLSKIPFYKCSIKEQEKIASFLSLIDERIAVQIGLIEDLKKLKSAITDKLFGGEKGEKVRLGDVGSFIRGLTYSTDDVSEKPNGAIVVRANNLIDGEEINTTVDIVRVHKEVPNNMILKRGDIAICMANGSTKLIGKNSFYNGTSKCPITVGAFCGIYRSSLSYVRWLLQTTRYKRYVYQSLQGGNGAIANLNGMDILNMKFFVPTEEICNNIIPLLQSVETKIQDEQSLLILNENLKAYLLRMMFI